MLEKSRFAHAIPILLNLLVLIYISSCKVVTIPVADLPDEREGAKGLSESKCWHFEGTGNCSGFYDCHCQGSPGTCTEDGICLNGCLSGWMGISCNTPCEQSQWGANCSRNCSVNCRYKKCDPMDGYCECADGAIQVGCSASTDDDFISSFWLTVCVLTLIGAILTLVYGVTCNQQSAAGKRKLLNVALKRKRSNTNSLKVDARGSKSSTNVTDVQAGLRSYDFDFLPNIFGKSTSKDNVSLQGSNSVVARRHGSFNGRLQRKRTEGSVSTISIPGRGKREGSHASYLEAEQPPVIKRRSRSNSRQLTQAMPDFKVQRKPRGKILDRYTIRKMLLQSAQIELMKQKSQAPLQGNINATGTRGPQSSLKKDTSMPDNNVLNSKE